MTVVWATWMKDQIYIQDGKYAFLTFPPTLILHFMAVIWLIIRKSDMTCFLEPDCIATIYHHYCPVNYNPYPLKPLVVGVFKRIYFFSISAQLLLQILVLLTLKLFLFLTNWFKIDAETKRTKGISNQIF